MDKRLELAAEKRAVTGKQVKQLRRQGLIPAVIHGHDVEPMALQVSRDSLAQLLKRGGRTAIVQLKVGRQQPVPVTLKEMQLDPMTGQLLHVDLYRVHEGEKLKMQVPLHFVGEAPVMKTHEAAVIRLLDHVQVECLPDDLPPMVEVDLSRLQEIGSAIRVSDLQVPPGVAILNGGDEVVVNVVAAAKEKEEVVEETAEEAAEEAVGAAEARAGETEEPGEKAA